MCKEYIYLLFLDGNGLFQNCDCMNWLLNFIYLISNLESWDEKAHGLRHWLSQHCTKKDYELDLLFQELLVSWSFVISRYISSFVSLVFFSPWLIRELTLSFVITEVFLTFTFNFLVWLRFAYYVRDSYDLVEYCLPFYILPVQIHL